MLMTEFLNALNVHWKLKKLLAIATDPLERETGNFKETRKAYVEYDSERKCMSSYWRSTS
jgi:hypothetical protein